MQRRDTTHGEINEPKMISPFGNNHHAKLRTTVVFRNILNLF